MKRYLSLALLSFAFISQAQHENIYKGWCSDVCSVIPSHERVVVKEAMHQMRSVIAEYELTKAALCAVVKRSEPADPYRLLGITWAESAIPAFLESAWQTVSGNAWHLIDKLRVLIFGTTYDSQILTSEEQTLPESAKWLIKIERCRTMLEECERMLAQCADEVTNECC